MTGDLDRVSYELSVTNGTGTNVADENDAKSFSGRVSLRPSEGVTVSGQVAVHDYPVSPSDDQYAPAWGVDLQLGEFRQDFLLHAAIVRGDNWRNLDGASNASTFTALQAVASYFAARPEGGRIEGIEPLARVSFGDPDTGMDDDAGFVFTPGFMLYLSGRNKVGANLDIWRPQAGDAEFSLKLQSFVYF